MKKEILQNYILLMLSMKPKGKAVDFNHIKEKVERDLKIKERKEVEEVLNQLISLGYINFKNGLYSASEKGREYFSKILPKIEKDLEKINKTWLIVYKSKKYYPIVKDVILEFCKNRHVGFYCLFTQKRFFRRDWKGKKIVIKSWKDLEFFVNIHCIDIIPCVHQINKEKPDWLVIDIDAGSLVPFEKVKEVTRVVYEIMENLELNPKIKFSGSRGFQVWSWIKDFKIPESYVPLKLKSERKREKNYFTLFSDFVRIIQKEVDKKIPNLTTSEISERQKREDKILLDPSSMKKNGLVRAPYSIHSKTGLISLPIEINEIDKFEVSQAKIENGIERFKERGNEFKLKEANPSKLLELVTFKSIKDLIG
ncbi:MAG: hypothetical protein B6U78_01650 [Candidatus Aenigmarchaeota archaeon ex4484_224]|nr:MAG: hypothetical protein B6U78_01650 [Candidatus Aenigmarchaeota archaeon ex4484_224]